MHVFLVYEEATQLQIQIYCLTTNFLLSFPLFIFVQLLRILKALTLMLVYYETSFLIPKEFEVPRMKEHHENFNILIPETCTGVYLA